MRLIDADALEREGWSICRTFQKDKGTMVYEMKKPSDFPTIEERKRGKWKEKHHAYADEEKIIEEWQSCKCSVCGRYDTRPYMYYFDEPHFCSWCGADMRGEKDETD